MYKDILKSTAHREVPLPDGPWLMTQKWNDLLFMHFPVSKEILREQVPSGLELDTYEGKTWMTLVPFRVSHMRLRNTPPVPVIHSFPELNVRTYVKREGLSGIYLFSLDAESLLSVIGGRAISLPYYYARIKMKKKKDMIYFDSVRKGSTEVNFKGSYQPISAPYYPDESSLSHWLLERYHLWFYRKQVLLRADIHHKQWRVSEAEVIILKQNMLPDFPKGFVEGSPFFHYSASKRILMWMLKKEKK